MKIPKEKSAVAARDAKRRLENPLSEAQKIEQAAIEVASDYVRFNERQIEIARDLEL